MLPVRIYESQFERYEPMDSHLFSQGKSEPAISGLWTSSWLRIAWNFLKSPCMTNSIGISLDSPYLTCANTYSICCDSLFSHNLNWMGTGVGYLYLHFLGSHSLSSELFPFYQVKTYSPYLFSKGVYYRI